MRFNTRLAPLALGLVVLLSPPVRASADGAFTPAQQTAIESMIHDYLLHHPDVMLDALRVANAKMKADAKDKAALEVKRHWKELVGDPETPEAGNPKGDVTVVEFFDYQCPYCKADLPIVQQLVAQDKKLRIVYKDLPLLGPASMTAARAALAAREQHKYEPFRLVMMNLKGQLADDTIFVVAKAVGIDVDRLKRDMDAPAVDQQLRANMALAKALDINATPTFVVGDQVVEGAIDLSGMKELVADARKK
jgi:protein-disulfide isomerase